MTAQAEKHSQVTFDRWFLILFLSLLCWRMLYLWFAPIELSPDEAYYWEWSRRLDWGYYSKPPMVAWIMALSTWLLGNSAFAVRVPAAILSTMGILFCYLTGRAMFSARAGFVAALLAAASPGACVAGFVMTIDAPLLFFWSLALYCVWRAVQAECGTGEESGKAAAWWAATALAAGAGFLTKQTMFAFWPVVFAFLFLGRDTRKVLRSWGVWASAALSALCLAPVIWWNMHHGWITLEHTAHHFEQTDRSVLDSLTTFLEFAGSQLGVISPLTCMLVFVTGAAAIFQYRAFLLRQPARNDGHTFSAFTAAGLLLMAGIAVLIPITLLSLKQRVNANWPAPFYVAPMIFVAAWHGFHFSLGQGIDRMRSLVKPAVITGAVMAVLVYALPIVIPAAGLEGTGLDPLVRVRGWKQLASAVESVMRSLPEPEKTFIVTRRRQTASELAFYMTGNPRPYRWSGNRRRVTTQYELWPGPGDDRRGWDALIIVDVDKELPQDLPSCFRDFSELPAIYIPLGNGRERQFNVYFGRDFDLRRIKQ